MAAAHRAAFADRTRKGGRKAAAKPEEPYMLMETLLKTKLCHFWQQGQCTRGTCSFAHGDQELHVAPNLAKTALCKFFKERGYCRMAQCTFAHSELELRERQPMPLNTDAPSTAGSRSESAIDPDVWRRCQGSFASQTIQRWSDVTDEPESTNEVDYGSDASWDSSPPTPRAPLGSAPLFPEGGQRLPQSSAPGGDAASQMVGLQIPPGYSLMWVPCYMPACNPSGGSPVDIMASAAGSAQPQASPTWTYPNLGSASTVPGAMHSEPEAFPVQAEILSRFVPYFFDDRYED